MYLSLRFFMALSVLAVLAVLAAVAGPASAGQFGPEPDAATQSEILGLRERAWRTWFSNDQAGFQQVVPAELVALGWGGGAWDDRTATLQRMAEFAKGGQAIADLEFTRNVFQRYGDVVILYTRFRLVLEAPDGALSETSGRGTEIFVRRDGKWIHTGWHLDAHGG
jgi:hypothetical protein